METPLPIDRNPDLEAVLVEQVAWLRRLARALIRDPEQAEDLVQDTLVVALERPPRETGALKGWLRRVLKNRHLERQRERQSRQRREQHSAQEEALGGADELIQRVQLQQQLADHLLALEPALRATLLLRYFEDLPPREIARRTEVPLATVKSRLARGLAQLRGRLDKDHGGDRSGWAVALVPLLGEGGTATATAMTLGGLTMSSKLWIAAAALCAGTGWWWLSEGDQPNVPLVDAPLVLGGSGAGAGLGGASPKGRSNADRQALESSAQAAPETRAIEPGVRTLHQVEGRALDLEGRGLGGVEVRLNGESALAISAPDGRFRLETPADNGRLEPASDRWMALRSGAWRLDSAIEALLVVAPAIELAGQVGDPWGRGIPDARVQLILPENWGASIGVSLVATFLESWSATTDGEGRFDLGRVPQVPGAELVAVAAGLEPARLPEPLASAADVWLQLEAPAPPPGLALRGRVLRPNGSPASEALVAIGLVSAPTDQNGAFVLNLERAGDTSELRAIEAGFLPATLQRPGQPGEGDSGWPENVELVLERAALTIQGVLIDDQGQPLPGGRVWIAEPERFGMVGAVPVQMEYLAAGGQAPGEALDSIARLADPDSAGGFDSAQPAFKPNALVHWVESDGEGRFTLRGLAPRDYVLNVADKRLHWGAVTDPIPAGSQGVKILCSADNCYARVRGRVVTSEGDPLPFVQITPWVTAQRQIANLYAGSSDVMRFFLGEGLTTDAEGRFEMTSVPKSGLSFYLSSDDIVPSYASVDSIEDPDDFVIEALARVPFQFSTTPGPDAPDAISATDRSGQTVDFLSLRADGYSNFQRPNLTDGQSGPLTLTSNAVLLHLYRAGLEIGSLPLNLRPGEPSLVTW